MGEVLVPAGELPRTGARRSALSRGARGRVPAAPLGAEGLRGAGRTEQPAAHGAVAGRGRGARPSRRKLELISAVDDYVFGYVLRADLEATQKPGDEEFDEQVLPFYEAQLETGDYPNISKLFEGRDAASGFDLVVGVFRDEGRFERGLERLLDGLEAALPRLR